ncbi:ABC transporter permease [Sulfurovum sp. bin170]|uniref:ABC transporter permease n=1 Tax=Sulfurovum sp. bin170 TaxID=2695268 RepID=UPI0013E01C54|nr:ABC transporter permease [Sulfurovum sp. bin170]NEW60323.1 ABC transporter permease [Sulfurovum sp. bin170]
MAWSGHYKDLFFELVKKDIKVRYKNSYLGYFWSLANPLLLSLVFYYLFKVVSKVDVENYALFLISALFVWQWILNSVIAGTTLYHENASLIKKVNFPRNFLVLSLVTSEGFNFLASIPILIGFILYYGLSLHAIWIVGIPLLLAITIVTIYSISLIVATLNLFFRDIERIMGIFMTFMFYLTPVLYPLSMIPDEYRYIVYINLFAPLIISWRRLFLDGSFDLTFLLLATLYSIVLYFFASKIYGKLKYKFAELV